MTSVTTEGAASFDDLSFSFSFGSKCWGSFRLVPVEKTSKTSLPPPTAETAVSYCAVENNNNNYEKNMSIQVSRS